MEVEGGGARDERRSLGHEKLDTHEKPAVAYVRLQKSHKPQRTSSFCLLGLDGLFSVCFLVPLVLRPSVREVHAQKSCHSNVKAYIRTL